MFILVPFEPIRANSWFRIFYLQNAHTDIDVPSRMVYGGDNWTGVDKKGHFVLTEGVEATVSDAVLDNGELTDAVMTLQEVAAYLKVSEKTITRMVQAGELPALKVSNQWRFIRAAIDDWMTRRMYGQANEQLAAVIQPPHAELSLSTLLTRNRIVMDLSPASKEVVLSRLVAPLVEEGVVNDPAGYMATLVGREKLVSTAIGDGVAIPHARDPEHSSLNRNCMVLGICREGMPFGAIDDKPTHLFFLIGGTSTEDHLRLVARTMLVLRRDGVIDGLIGAGDAGTVLNIVAQAQADIDKS